MPDEATTTPPITQAPEGVPPPVATPTATSANPNATPPPPVPASPPPTIELSVPAADPNRSLKIMAVIAVVLAIIGLLIFLILPILTRPKTVPVEPPPPPVKIETPPIATPAAKSKFASDAGVLKIRDDLKRTNINLDAVDLFEPELTLPNIDQNITVK